MEILSSKDFIKGWVDLQEERKANPNKYRPRSTGIRALDKALGGGVEHGQLVIYGGKQKVGKSTLLQHTATTFGKNRDPFGYFSIEMNNASMATRVLCDLSGVEKNRIRNIEWNKQEWDMLMDEAKQVEEYDAWWAYGLSTIKGIKQAILKIDHDHGIFLDTIFVDYIQLMSHPGKSVRQEELSEISHQFKRMSIEMKKPMLIFLAAQVNRDAAKNHVISANSFLGTGAIERDMDVGIIMHEVKDENSGKVRDDVRMLTIVGSRDTGLDTVPVRFNGTTASIRDMEVEDNEITLDYWRKQAEKAGV